MLIAPSAHAEPPAPIPEPILPPLAPGQVIRIGPTAGTGTPTRDYGVGATDLCEFMEFPSGILQICGDSFAGQGVGFGGWWSPIALHVETDSIDEPTGVRYDGVMGVDKPLLADPPPPGTSQLPSGVVQINRESYMLVTTTRDLVVESSRLVKADAVQGNWPTIPGSARDAGYRSAGEHHIGDFYALSDVGTLSTRPGDEGIAPPEPRLVTLTLSGQGRPQGGISLPSHCTAFSRR